ncbi:phage portal protein [Gryllotalpicola daejeonensis]|uniref:Phage portal protein n=1 Tax=Gryllotalpicola daejeonensis TaxID=993087 RepID=A0ABP7ZFG2_9MICO
MGFWRSLGDVLIGADSAPVQRRSDAEDAAPTQVPTWKQQIQAVRPHDALGLAAAYRCVSIITTALGQMDIEVLRGSDIIDAPVWIRQPDISQSRAAFIEQTATGLALHGNAYWLVTKDAFGRVQNVKVLDPRMVTITWTQDGTVTGYNWNGQTLTPDQVYHLALLRLPGDPYGLGPIQADQRGLRGAIDARDFASARFNGPTPQRGYLSVNEFLDDDQIDQAKTAWIESMQADNDIALLTGGATWNDTSLTAVDAQWIEGRQYDTNEVARLFGIPGALIDAPAAGGSMTYSNVVQMWSQFVRFGLSNFYREIEEAFSWLLPRGTTARFDVEGLLRADTTTRYAAYASAISAGWMLRSEVRAAENLPPVDGIDAVPAPTAPSDGETE